MQNHDTDKQPMNDLVWHCKEFSGLSLDELYEMMALRIQVFVVEQNCPYQEADGKDKKSLHLFALNTERKCMACLRLVKPGVSYEEWSIGRVVSNPSARRNGLGRGLMQRAMAFLKNEKANPPVRISAQSYLREFYEGFGFICVSEEYLEDNIPHIEMLYTP